MAAATDKSKDWESLRDGPNEHAQLEVLHMVSAQSASYLEHDSPQLELYLELKVLQGGSKE